jgi:ubiquinone/menaquinone biosynthesis C-methylase UbiE
MLRGLAIGIAGVLAVSIAARSADGPAKKAEKSRYEYRVDHDPDGIGKYYMGREIAQVMGYAAAGWLERKEREEEEAPQKLLKALEVKEGMVIADVGAGSGYHSIMIAPLVGPKGKVIASDIQQEMLDLIAKKAKDRKVTNVETVKGTATDPKLPAGKVDLILMVDVYHEFEHPFEMTEKMVAALAPSGRLVFVEFRLEDDKVPIKLLHKMSERQVIKEMAAFPELKHTKTVATLPWQHVIVFTRQEKK